jgi:hypothetical protein
MSAAFADRAATARANIERALRELLSEFFDRAEDIVREAIAETENDVRREYDE